MIGEIIHGHSEWLSHAKQLACRPEPAEGIDVGTVMRELFARKRLDGFRVRRS